MVGTKWGSGRLAKCLGLFAVATLLAAQIVPPSPERPWHSGLERQAESSLGRLKSQQAGLEPDRVYSLAELVAFAEAHNPETRAAWENARAQASAVGVARSELYPQLAAIAFASISRAEIPSGQRFYRQTVAAVRESMKRQSDCCQPISASTMCTAN